MNKNFLSMRETENTTVFVSWSGGQSQEFAEEIKNLLYEVFSIEKSEIFISKTNMAGSKGWLEEIRQNASASKIEIVCITEDNYEKPWIHYELGICSFLEQNHQEKNANKNNGGYHKRIIPFLINITIKDIPSHFEMLTSHHAVSWDGSAKGHTGSEEYFQNLIKQLIFQVSKAVNEHKLDCDNFKLEDTKDKKLNKFEEVIKRSSKEMAKIYLKYQQDIFISRPIQGIEAEIAEEILVVLNNIKKHFKDKKKIYFASGDGNIINIPLSRLDIIKNCKIYILIYPKIEDKENVLAPSSCFIELGAAMALDKQIKIFVQKGAILPAFLSGKMQFDKEEYDTNDQLEKMIKKFLMQNEK